MIKSVFYGRMGTVDLSSQFLSLKISILYSQIQDIEELEHLGIEIQTEEGTWMFVCRSNL